MRRFLPHPDDRPFICDGEASRMLGVQPRYRWAWYLGMNLSDAAACALVARGWVR